MSTTQCWLWPGTLDADGYGDRGSGKNDGFSRKAHRAMYEMVVGPIPKGMMILHSCDVPRCVNPSHLRIGTAVENALDALERGRLQFGESSSQAKLTSEQVGEIRRRRSMGERGVALAAEFGVSPSTICDIKHGRTRLFG